MHKISVNIPENMKETVFQTLKAERGGKNGYDDTPAASDLGSEEIANVNVHRQHDFEDIYQNLPDLLFSGVNALTEDKEREVFLMCALPVLSGCMLNVTGLYDGNSVGANLYLFLLAPYGSGKGAARYAKILGSKIHKAKRDKAATEKTEYEAKKAEYDQKIRQVKKNGGTVPEPIAEAKNSTFFIPANSSKTGFFELLADNGGAGIVFESEADTLNDIMSQDYGNYSDGLRCAAHHETISFYRRLNKEFVEIEKPCLSLVLTGTPEQLRKLIPHAENGLFSRFMFYQLEAAHDFKNVFDNGKDGYESAFQGIAAAVKEMYDRLEERGNPVTFSLTKAQKEKFLTHFANLKKESVEYISDSFGGVVNRLGLMTFRVAMILTVLRHESQSGKGFPDSLICQDLDFDTALKIVAIFYSSSLQIFQNFPKHKTATDNQFAKKATDIQTCIKLYGEGKTYKEIAVEVFKNDSKKSQVYYYVNGRK